MSNFSVEDVVGTYVGLRDEKRQLEALHEEQLKPINEKLEKIEAWLLAKMNTDGVDSYKTRAGTAYKSVKTSCQMADSNMFKEFVFAPVVKAIQNVLDNAGLANMDGALRETITTSALWDLVDFRALKKGVEEFIEDHKAVPPGLNVAQTTTVNIRKS